MENTKKFEYSEPRTSSGTWDIDWEYNNDDEPFGDNLSSLTLMRDGKSNNGLKQMITSLDDSLPQDQIGENDLRLMLSAPLMYKMLKRIVSEGDSAEKVEIAKHAISCVENFEFPWRLND